MSDDDSDVLAADRAFFAALLAADAAAVQRMTTEDFLIVDVLSGDVTVRQGFTTAVGEGAVRFTAIEPGEAVVRRYGSTAVVVGRTRMSGDVAGTSWTVRSRYTHVYVHDGARWRLASAQGTPIDG